MNVGLAHSPAAAPGALQRVGGALKNQAQLPLKSLPMKTQQLKQWGARQRRAGQRPRAERHRKARSRSPVDGKGAFLLRERRSERALGPHRPRYAQKQCREVKGFNIKRKQFKALGKAW